VAAYWQGKQLARGKQTRGTALYRHATRVLVRMGQAGRNDQHARSSGNTATMANRCARSCKLGGAGWARRWRCVGGRADLLGSLSGRCCPGRDLVTLAAEANGVHAAAGGAGLGEEWRG
jgi:hypothetical protein